MRNFVRNRPSLSGFTALAALLFAVFAGLLLSAPPAAAHDELTGSVPADGAVLDSAPEAVELTFSNTPAAIGSEVRVLAEDGTDWADGDVRILDNTATQRLRDGAPAGTYTVQWRVVSSDAHPIEGTFGFTAAGGEAETAPAAGPSVQPSEPGDSSQTPVLNQGEDTGLSWQVVVPAVVVLIAVAVLIALIVRRRLRED
ncbi:copper resistance protein CopC [Arthrobacter sp. zg-Y411]|uniref:copper resistance CopC family protein n=1 Tax=Arthrobacter zhangbolii TaxID=2886936 RepID=UPI001D139A27|nr:copper resistance protein CopC [Arthrobacter zhangbolii]